MSSLLLSPPARLWPYSDTLILADGFEPQKGSLANRSLEISQKNGSQISNPSSAARRASTTPAQTDHFNWNDVNLPLNKQSLATLLKEETHLYKCHYLHHYLTKIGLDRNVFFKNMTLNMYGRCGALDDAHHLFLCSRKDTPAWNAMIGIFTQNGHHKDALQLFFEMQHQSVELTSITFMNVLTSCDHPSTLMDGVVIHAFIVEYGFEGNEFLGSALVTMYGKCQSIEEAGIMFHKLYHPNVISWTTMISILANNGLVEDAFKHFEVMQDAGMSPSRVTFLAVLAALHDPLMLDVGNTIHACITKCGFDCDCFLGTSLIKMYGELALLEEAQHVFDSLRDRTIVSWNVLIDAYAQNEEGERALQLFWHMQGGGLQPDAATYVGALNACLSLESLTDGRAVHACVKGTEFEGHVVVATALVTMYSRCGDLHEAYTVFEGMCHRNVVSWNTLIGEYTEHGFGKEPLQFFYQMLEEGVMVSKVTYLNILGACETLAAPVECMRFHARIWGSEWKTNAALEAALINTYGKCGHLEEARFLFDRTEQRNVIFWNMMISVYVQHGHDEEALALFTIMQQEEATLDQAVALSALKACSSLSFQDEGRSIHTTAVRFGLDLQLDVGTALVGMYGKWGAFEEANVLFGGLCVRNIVTWNTLIGLYAQHGCICEAMQCLQKMKEEHAQPDRFTFISILSTCASSSSVEEGKALHALILSEGLEQCISVGTTLISMYGKCGDLEAAHSVFDKMHEQGVIAWNCMLATYAQLGLGRKAYEFYLQMLDKGPMPDAVTFLSVLSACSHAGLFEEGLSCFSTMRDGYKIEPKLEHFGCMVDLYGRSGELKEAERFIYKMQLEGHALVWRTLLASCKVHNNVEIGRLAAKFAIDLDPDNPSSYILLSNLFAKNQMLKDVAVVRERMIERGLSDCLDAVKS
ncbi:hypothetical protein GOP47_0024144 [Adiantum capillus-veneris]|uniref:Pentatricopeptide repeat-containing protein n=1 Tax=Adiantum capillus-veneris TaxID=13818 RepID=A0A9D4U4V5_ADICA|nr:hypothetical protein GOP47_0024144 [Adiantum capillus-veneris]